MAQTPKFNISKYGTGLDENGKLLPLLQFAEVARAYMKAKHLGLIHRRSLTSIGIEDFDLTTVEIASVKQSVCYILKKVGIPKISEEISSPCHSRVLQCPEEYKRRSHFPNYT
jgi:hypothetical protein